MVQGEGCAGLAGPISCKSTAGRFPLCDAALSLALIGAHELVCKRSYQCTVAISLPISCRGVLQHCLRQRITSELNRAIVEMPT